MTHNFGEEVTDFRTGVGVEEPCVLSRYLRFVDSNAEFEGVDDAPFSYFAVDGVDFVGMDEAGFHDEESAYLFRYAEFGGGFGVERCATEGNGCLKIW